MLPTARRLKKAAADNPKKLASLIDLANLPSPLRDFLGKSLCSRLTCFIRVWSYIKTNNLQDPNNQNIVNCDDKLKGILLGGVSSKAFRTSTADQTPLSQTNEVEVSQGWGFLFQAKS